jgi:hypothetical protein
MPKSMIFATAAPSCVATSALLGLRSMDDPLSVGVFTAVQTCANHARRSLRFEARDDLARVRPQLDDFQRDPTPHGLQLLGNEDAAKPAFADLLQQAVGSNLRPWRLRARRGRLAELSAV